MPGRINKASLAVMVAIMTSSLAIYAVGSNSSGTYWVSIDGTATWANCESTTPLSGTSACAMATANKNAAAGDTINIRGGIYHTNIQPVRSGTATDRLTYQGYGGETVEITKVGNVGGIELNGIDYVKIT